MFVWDFWYLLGVFLGTWNLMTGIRGKGKKLRLRRTASREVKMVGKMIRLERIMNRVSGRTVIVPMDHGVTLGPISGIVNMKQTIDRIADGGANAVIVHKGVVRAGHRGSGKDIGLIIHLSASTSLSPDPNSKTLVCSVEEAIFLGGDAVSIHINLGASTEPHMLAQFGAVAKDCQRFGIPLIAMVYTRGKKITSEFEVKYVRHAARVGSELGADIVKINYTGSPESFKEVVEGCPVPVVIAGGEKVETDEQLLKMIDGSLIAGGAGVSIGRNTFQHKDPTKIVQVIGQMVHKNLPIKDALKMLKE